MGSSVPLPRGTTLESAANGVTVSGCRAVCASRLGEPSANAGLGGSGPLLSGSSS